MVTPKSFPHLRRYANGFPITVFYAFKQSETDDEGGHASTGWETLLEGMITSGWAVTGTWPVRTELATVYAGSLPMHSHLRLSLLVGRVPPTQASPTVAG